MPFLVLSYYHEKFLRGLKFLCRRMSRQKINGNGIRAAGNPDEEPALVNYPVCPPSLHPSNDNSDTESSEESSDTSPPSRASTEVARLILHTVGSSEAATLTNDSPKQNSNVDAVVRRTLNRGIRMDSSSGSAASFPLKLQVIKIAVESVVPNSFPSRVSSPCNSQRILDKAEAEGRTDVVSWLPHGHAFLVHDVDRFVSEVMSQYFNQTKYSSFQRQLHMYNFQRITFGRDKGA
jgi:HSF-type DNA-binding